MNFREQARQDLDEMFCADEMAEELIIGGVSLVVLVEYKKADKAGGQYGNYARHQVNTEIQRLFIREKDMPNAPVVNSKMSVGDVWYTVTSAKNVMGLHTIELEVNL